MDFSERQSDPKRKLTGIVVVIMFHAIVAYALMSGLARRVVDVVRAPIDAKVIEELMKPPPPPEVAVQPPPKLEAPPPPFIPPPEVPVAVPPAVQPTITAAVTAPPANTDITPVAPVAPAPAPAAPAMVSAAVVCANYSSVMGEAGFPRDAERQGLEKGEALIQFTLGAAGEVKDIRALRASHPIFARNSIRIVGDYKCAGQGRDVVVQVPFGYQLN
jgi:periplasmic protein TonB